MRSPTVLSSVLMTLKRDSEVCKVLNANSFALQSSHCLALNQQDVIIPPADEVG